MNHIIRQLLALRREQEARDRDVQWAPHTEQPGPGSTVLRRGVAKIVSNDGGGEYTVTEQWWDPESDWDDAKDPVGHVEAPARDYRQRDSGLADDYVLFWESRAKGGKLELLLDVDPRWLCWGKAVADWSSGNEVTLDPCECDGTDIPDCPNVKGYIVSPTEANPADGDILPEIFEDDVLAYIPFGEQEGVIVNVKWVLSDQAVGDATGIDKVLDRWIRVTQATGGTTISNDDWRGRVLWCSVRCYDGSVAGSLQDAWTALGETGGVLAAKVGTTFDEDADEVSLTLFSGDTANYTIEIYLQENTGKLGICACAIAGGETQVRVTVRATPVKTVPDQTV